MSALNAITSPSVCGRKYVLDEKIEQGVYGIVFRGHPMNQPTQVVAVKKPLLYSSDSPHTFPERVRMLWRETMMVQRAQNLNVVRYIDHSFDMEDTYLVLEYVPETLADRVRENMVTQAVVSDFLLQIPNLLHFLRERRLVHGDIKCSNVGYDSRRLIKALDFGQSIPLPHPVRRSAKLPSDDQQLWCPPEFREGLMVTVSFDTYTAGRTLEFLLTQDYADSTQEIVDKIEQEYAVSIPSSFANLLQRMLDPDYACRPSPEELRSLCHQAVKDFDENPCFPLDSKPIPARPIQWFGDTR